MSRNPPKPLRPGPVRRCTKACGNRSGTDKAIDAVSRFLLWRRGAPDAVDEVTMVTKTPCSHGGSSVRPAPVKPSYAGRTGAAGHPVRRRDPLEQPEWILSTSFNAPC
ncbi:hypothetical protein Shyhy01_08140 [Streptomyces hygroscopicus subsp. hygroscopicus]|nr:hypothetical protein Shyhy01_08140 [Streptomyces hygroscopicus subsp. hygroscopicus]